MFDWALNNLLLSILLKQTFFVVSLRKKLYAFRCKRHEGKSKLHSEPYKSSRLELPFVKIHSTRPCKYEIKRDRVSSTKVHR